MIRADRLTKRYGTLLALRDLSFEVEPGEVLGFLGPNGAGKSTALRILSGYLPPSSGRASIAGLDLLRRSLAARRRLGYLPETFAAPPELRVGEYLRYRAGLKGMGRRERRARAGEVAERLGLQDRMRQPFGALSKGYRQRVGLADALLAQPAALLLDEPFGGLDPLQRQEFRRLLRRLAAEGCAVLFSSHVLPEVQDLADRVLILHQGEARAAGTWQSLAATLEREQAVRVVTAGDAAALESDARRDPELGSRCPFRERVGPALVFESAGPEDRQALLAWLVARGEPVLEFRGLAPTLEELFEQVVGEPAAPREAPQA